MKNKAIIFMTSIVLIIEVTAQVQHPIHPFEKGTISKSKLTSLQEKSNEKSTVLWSDDFSTPSHWSSTNTSLPAHGWEITTFIDSLPYVTFNPFSSPSAINGFALVDATNALMNTQTNTDLTWVGNPIDLTGHSNVLLQFYNATHVYNSTYTVWVSGNNGTNWTPFEVNNTLTHTQNPELISLNISSVAGNQGQVLIRFSFEGTSGWFWAIDDVSIIDMDDYDLKFSNLYWGSEGAWGSRIGYYKIPVSQIAPIKFSGIIEKLGIQDQSNVDFVVSSTSYSSTGTASNISSSTKDTIHTTLDFTPLPTPANHTFNLGLTSPNTDADLSNNSWPTFTASVTPYDYSRSLQTPTGFVHNNGNGYELGCIYDFFSPLTFCQIKVYIHPSTEIGNEIFTSVYSYDSISGEYIFENTSQPIPIQNNMLSTFLTLNLLTPMTILPGKSLLITVGSFGSMFGISDGLVIGTSKNNSNGSSFFYDYNSALWYEMNDVPMVGIFTDDFYCFTGIHEFNNPSFSIQQNYPNPCGNQTTIHYQIIQGGEYTLEVVDVSGKTIKTVVLGKKPNGEYSYELDTSTFSEGVYFYSLTDGISRTTKRMLIQH